MHGKRALRMITVALVGSVLGGAAARAQAPHAIPPLMRPLHQRAAEAEKIAIGVVVRSDAGRIAFAKATAIRGAAPAEFELKRSPLRPPMLAKGDRALLFLRGDRSPYVLAGDPSEILRIASDAEARALVAALPALLDAGDDLAALARVYASWAASDSRLLRALAHEGLAALPPAAPRPPAHRRV